MMPLETEMSFFANKVYSDILNAMNIMALPFKGVYYGDQSRIPTTPIVCIEPNRKVRELDGVPRKTLVTIELYLLVYVDSLTNPEKNRRDSDAIVEQLEAFLHANPRLDDTCIHSLVTAIESGAVAKGQNTVMRASRLTFEITTQQKLPQ
jgi:hypothetical protein